MRHELPPDNDGIAGAREQKSGYPREFDGTPPAAMASTESVNAEDGGQGRNGLASLALRAHFVRLSALRASVEPPTRGFSVWRWDLFGFIFQ
jgi:hypothetical protein